MKSFTIHLSLQLILLLHLITGAVSRASFGDSCTPDVGCDSQKFLTCANNGRCNCLLLNSMIFDHTTGQCVTLAGERCEYTTVQGDHSWSETIPCIFNAACKNGICECARGYYSLNGTCQRKRDHGEDCVNSDMCEEKYLLVCGENRKCSCHANLMFSKTKGLCVLRAGQPCDSGQQCPEFSDCSGTCNCRPGYFQTEMGTCEEKRYVGQPCLHNGQCKDKVYLPERGSDSVPSLMVCLEGKCQCDVRVAREYSMDGPDKMYCGKQVSMPCSYWEANNCIKGATCDGATATCQCNQSTHFLTDSHTCSPWRLYGQPCSDRSPCDQAQKFLSCSSATKTCVCDEGGVLDPDSKECRGSPGTQCRLPGIERRCVPNADCSQVTNKCQCIGVTGPSTSRKDQCYVREGGTCFGDVNEPITSQTCMPGLLCSNTTCSCPYKDFQSFDITKEKCGSKLAGPCNFTGDCVETNNVCAAQADGSGLLQCRCKPGYIEARGKCQIAFGGRCGKRGNDVCDPVAPLECSSQGICECARQHVYDNVTDICRGMVGAKCDLRWSSLDEDGPPSFCVDGAFCKRFRGSFGNFGVCKCRQGWKAQKDGTCLCPPQIGGCPSKDVNSAKRNYG